MKYGQKMTLAMLRKIAGYTQETFAEAIGVDRCTIAFWETGRTHPSGKNIAKVEQVLDIKWAEDVLMPQE